MKDAKGQLDPGSAQAISAALGPLSRSATASIRGYLTQLVYTALAWCELGDNGVIVVEGREDLDQLILNPDGTVREITEIQVKDLGKSVNARSEPVWRSIFNFLLSHREHRAGNREPRMIFATTADFKAQATSSGSGPDVLANGVRLDLPVDVVSTWRSLPGLGGSARTLAVEQLIQSVEALFDVHLKGCLVQGNSRRAESAFALLVQSTMESYTVSEWSDFFTAVTWEPQLASAARLTERLQARIACHPVFEGLPAAELAQILIYEVLTAASRKDVTSRILTHGHLVSIASRNASALVEWAKDRGMVNLNHWQVGVDGRLAQHDARLDELETSVAEVMPSQQRARDDLRRFSSDNRRRVLSKVGSLTLDRAVPLARIRQALEESVGVLLIGASGSGKSALAKTLTEALDQQGGLSLWLAASSLERPDLAALNADITKEMPLAKVFEGHPGRRVLVLDGLDRAYESSALKLVVDLMHGLRVGQDCALSQVLITCQTADREALERELVREGIDTSAWCVIECPAPTPDELAPVFAAVPSIRQMSADSRVAALLQNLKILDLIVGRASHAGNAMPRHFVGETSVAAWFWRNEVERGLQRRSRELFVMRLAERQADQLRLSLPISALCGDEGSVIDALEADRVCQVDERHNVLFAHDLYADWARLRVLQSHADDLPQYLEKRLDSPLWHRAVRLLGADFLDVRQDVDGWKALLSQLQHIGGSSAADLLLESIVFSANAPDHLRLLSTELLAQGSCLLDRLLGRFLAFATLPDPKMQALARANGLNAAQFESSHRCPNTAYWPAVLEFLNLHRDQVVRLAPERVGQVVRSWLEHTSTGAPLRRETAETGLLLGRLALDQHSLDFRELLFETALAGAEVCRNEVCSFALEACERTTVRVCQANGITDLFFDPDQPLPAPCPDGPNNPVDQTFRGVVLKGRALRPLMRAAPAVAREVILACLLSARNPTHRHTQTKEWDLELCNVIGWPTAAYFQGPFIDLLNQDFKEGLETVARLVDFVAGQWVQRRKQDEHAVEKGPYPDSGGQLVSQIGTGRRVYLGDCRIFGWSAALGAPHPSSIVTSALMALEHYLYTRMQPGAGIDDLVTAVLERTQSVPFLGMLLDVGRKAPQLFTGVLLPLLGIPEVYSWDRRVRARGRAHLDLTSFNQGTALLQARWIFNSLPHRKLELLQIAAKAFFKHDNVSTFMLEKVRGWERHIATLQPGEAQDEYKQLVMVFTKENYQPDGKDKLVNTALVKWNAETQREPDMCSDRDLLVFTLRCDGILRQGGLAECALPEFLQTLQRVETRWKEVTGQGYGTAKANSVDLFSGVPPAGVSANAFAAGIAVLVCRHPDWVEQQGAVEWCIDSLLEIASNPPPMDDWDCSDAVNPWTWDRYCAQASVALWQKCPGDGILRALLAFFAFAEHDETVRRLIHSVATIDPPRFDDLQRLRRIVFEHSFLRKRVEFVRMKRQRHSSSISNDELQRSNAALSEWKSLQLEGFVLSQSKHPAQSWAEMDTSGYFSHFDNERAGYGGYQLDFSLIRAAHERAMDIGKAVAPQERAYQIWFLTSALDFWCSLMIGQEGRTFDFYPDEDLVWLLKQLARCIVELGDDENAQLIWRRVLTLPKKLLPWTEQFLEELFRTTLSAEQIPESTLVIISSFYEYVCTRPESERWNEYEDIWQVLFGIDSITVHRWKARHGQLAERLWPALKQWMACHPSAGHAASVAGWLMTPAAVKVRLQSLEMFQYLPGCKPGAWSKNERKSIEDSVAKLLHCIWTENPDAITRSPQNRERFQRLLRWLAERQHPQGLTLTGQIGGL